jgi:hypothetical protein
MRLWDPDDGEEFISWREMWQRMYPMTDLSPEYDEPSGDWDAAEMNRLRGVAIVQAAETEAVLAQILRILDPSAGRTLMAGPLLRAVRKQLDAQTLDRWSQALDVIKEATNRRNRLVHDTVQVGYSWREYATGGGTHVPVISLLGNEDRDEVDLQNDLNLQRRATRDAIEVLHYLKHRKTDPAAARYCEVCIQEQEDDHQASGGG